MDMLTTRRGDGLRQAGKRFARPLTLLARLAAPAFGKVLDRIDRALISGALHARLPDGTRRTLGGRAAGFE